MKLKKLLVAVVAASLVTAFILPTRAADNPAATVTEENTPEVVAEEEAPEVVVDETDDSEGAVTTDTTDVLSETPKEATENTLPEIKETETTEEASTPAAAPVLRNQPVRGPADENIIPDEMLKRCINKTLNRPKDHPVTKKDVESLTSLSVYKSNNLKGLEYATNLKQLSVQNSTGFDFSPIINLKKLNKLTVHDVRLTDLTAIGQMTNLTDIQIYDCPITDITPLKNLSQLKVLKIRNSYITDITPLADLTGLEELYLWKNYITDISPIRSLTHLKRLFLEGTRNADFTPVPKGLDFLNLADQKLYVFTDKDTIEMPVIDTNGSRDFDIVSTYRTTVTGNKITLASGANSGKVQVKSKIPSSTLSATIHVYRNYGCIHTVYGKSSISENNAGTTVNLDPYVSYSGANEKLPYGKGFKNWKILSGNGTITDPNAMHTTLVVGMGAIFLTYEFQDGQATAFDLKYPANTVPVEDPESLTEEEKQAVEDAVRAANPSLPVNTKILVYKDYVDLYFPDLSHIYLITDKIIKPKGETIHLSVQDGTGSGDYTQDAVVDIAANAAPEGKAFHQWVLVSGNATIADVNAPTTKVTLGTEDATVKATYTDVTYNLTVQDGSGSGDYAQDAVVDITANAAPEGKVFDQWVLVSGNATIANVNAPTTKVTLGTEDATVKATYTDVTHHLTVQDGSGSGDYAQDAVVDITANAAPEGKTFDQWVLVSGNATIADVNAPATKVTLGTEDATVKATYKDITYKLTIEAGQGSGDYVQDAVVDITADAAPEGKVFDQWVLVNGDATIDDVNAVATKVTMGTQDATIQATYKDAPKQPVDDPNDDNKPGDNKPGDNKPGDNKPGDNKPGDNKPGDNKPGDNKPGDNKPGDNKPGDNKPGDNKPGDNKPGDNKPGKTPTGATGVKRPMPSTGIPGETLTLLTMISLLGGAYAGRKFGHGKK